MNVFFFFRARQLMPRMHLSVRLIVQKMSVLVCQVKYKSTVECITLIFQELLEGTSNDSTGTGTLISGQRLFNKRRSEYEHVSAVYGTSYTLSLFVEPILNFVADQRICWMLRLQTAQVSLCIPQQCSEK
jgi:hypothetical protein